MIQRCTNPKFVSYPRYGGRGIRVCDRWRDSFEAFLSDMGERPIGATLDRVDNIGNYEPDNCRWATYREQARNRATKLTASLAAEIRSRVGAGESKASIARSMCVCPSTVRRVAAGKLWLP